MKMLSGLLRHVCLASITGALALCLYPAASQGATGGSIVESKLEGATILTSPAQKLIAAVGDSVKENHTRSGDIMTAVLMGGRADADAIAPKVTATAIVALGDRPSQDTVSSIVYSSVKATPAVVLEIVRASVKVAPDYAKIIARAAIRAIPDPSAKIAPLKKSDIADTTDTNVTDEAPSDGYTKDSSKDGKDLSKDSQPLEPIAEAIMEAANVTDLGKPTFTTTSVYPGYYYPPLVVSGTLPTPSDVSK